MWKTIVLCYWWSQKGWEMIVNVCACMCVWCFSLQKKCKKTVKVTQLMQLMIYTGKKGMGWTGERAILLWVYPFYTFHIWSHINVPLFKKFKLTRISKTKNEYQQKQMSLSIYRMENNNQHENKEPLQLLNTVTCCESCNDAVRGHSITRVEFLPKMHSLNQTVSKLRRTQNGSSDEYKMVWHLIKCHCQKRKREEVVFVEELVLHVEIQTWLPVHDWLGLR